MVFMFNPEFPALILTLNFPIIHLIFSVVDSFHMLLSRIEPWTVAGIKFVFMI